MQKQEPRTGSGRRHDEGQGGLAWRGDTDWALRSCGWMHAWVAD